MSIKISEKADPKLLRPGAEVTFDREGDILPIPVPTPPLVIIQKMAHQAHGKLEHYIKGIYRCEPPLPISDDDVKVLEQTLRLIEKHEVALKEETGYEDLS